MSEYLYAAQCPACNYGVASIFLDCGKQTLATLGWPSSAQAATEMQRYPHDFVQCPRCSHVWNRSFTYESVPYQRNPNRMFNGGGIWKGHLAFSRDLLIERLPAQPTVVDIGCGEGHFVRGIAEACRGLGRFIGFDPNSTQETGLGLEFYATLFEPLQHFVEIKPDALIIRHVLEHLANPSNFVDQLAWASTELQKPCLLFAEVPCIDRVFQTERLSDFFYEHVSHFTTESFLGLMSRAGRVIELAHGYSGEVVFALVELGPSVVMRERAKASIEFSRAADHNRSRIKRQLDLLAERGDKIAFWGGTGKAAAFINQYGADAVRFPLVVDSDPDKIGTFVPGTGQEILFRDVLKDAPPDIIIIPAQWRARDIASEIQREGINCSNLLVEMAGQLVDYKFYLNFIEGLK